MTQLYAFFRGVFAFVLDNGIAIWPYLALLVGTIRNGEATSSIEHMLSFCITASGVLFLVLNRLFNELRGLRSDLKAFRADLGPVFALLREVHLVRGHYNEDGEFIADNGEN